jgi:type II secretory pathway pseudopilin PulG
MNKYSGQSIIEMVIAVGISALVLVTLLNVVVRSLYNANLARQKAQGTNLLSEMVEWLRTSRDTIGWPVLLTDIGSRTSFCLETLPATGRLSSTLPVPVESSSTPCPATIDGTSFYRYVTLTSIIENEINFTGVVQWSDSKGDHKSESIFKLSNWR